jgi:hypothetical protein
MTVTEIFGKGFHKNAELISTMTMPPTLFRRCSQSGYGCGKGTGLCRDPRRTAAPIWARKDVVVCRKADCAPGGEKASSASAP